MNRPVLRRLFWERHDARTQTRLRRFLLAAPETRDPARLRSLLGHLILVRVTILSILLAAYSWETMEGPTAGGRYISGFMLIAVTYALSLANAIWLQKSSRPTIVGSCQLSADVLLSTLAIYVTQSGASIFLYLLVIVGAAVTFSRFGAVIVAASSAICYSALASGVLSPLTGEPPPNTTAQDVLGVYLSMVVIALVSSYMTSQLEAIESRADASVRTLNDLSKQQRQLFNEVSDGIITLDLNATITGINEAARAIIGLASLGPAEFLGRTLSEVFSECGISEGDRLLDFEKFGSTPSEVTFMSTAREQEIHLNYCVKPISDTHGHETGKILIFNDVSEIKNMEERLHLHERMTKLLAEQNDAIQRPLLAKNDVPLIGDSPVMLRIYSLIERVSYSDASILISGESGTGKEIIAKAIHRNGPRRDRPFVAINCGAIPENLIESELFGHRKGAFTGAVQDNPGLFKQAHTGTLFLDEIGELPLHLQTKLLRALQEKSIRAVGDTRDVQIDVRIIAATNRDLKKEVLQGRFREDLYYRLNVVNIIVPPLRERRTDIPLLVRYFMAGSSGDSERPPQVSPEALQLLVSYLFPGNVRELENIIERALVLGGSAILPEHLPDEVLQHSRALKGGDDAKETEITLLPVDLEAELAAMERNYLCRALAQAGGIKKHAAELLGLNFRSFRYRLKKYALGDNSGESVDDNP